MLVTLGSQRLSEVPIPVYLNVELVENVIKFILFL